jgi:predicted  nucleic acid-binding Zn-ribbon protein
MGPIASTIEKLLDQRATTDSQIQYIDERLKRIEKIIDRLQLSILQKVGDYVTNVEDIKREVIETQKTFKSVLGQRDKSKNQ